MLRTMRTVLWAALLGWAIVSALVALFVRGWLRERYKRQPLEASRAMELLRPGRGWLHPVREILERFRLESGNTVLELGPGPGYFSVEASRIVGPSGRVVCLDIQRDMIAILNDRLRTEGAGNADPVVGDATRLPLAGDSVDKAFLFAVLGEIPDRPAALGELRRVLRPGAVLGFSETLTDPDYIFMASLDDLCRAFGFERLEERGVLLGYTMTFRAPRNRG